MTATLTDKPILFQSGRIVITPGALVVTTDPQRQAFVDRHTRGDFGVSDDDAETNGYAIESGHHSILSAYPIDPAKPTSPAGDNIVWIVTAANRRHTTIMLPHEH